MYKYQLFSSCHFPSVLIFKMQESIFNIITVSAFPIKTTRQTTKGGKRETWNKYWAWGKEEKTKNTKRGKNPHKTEQGLQWGKVLEKLRNNGIPIPLLTSSMLSLIQQVMLGKRKTKEQTGRLDRKCARQ